MIDQDRTRIGARADAARPIRFACTSCGHPFVATAWGWLVLACVATGTLAPASRAEELRVPTDHESIQEAIDAALEGDTVAIEAGTYRETISIMGRQGLSIIGEGEVWVDGETATPLAIWESSKIDVSGVNLRSRFGRWRVVEIFESTLVTLRNATIEEGSKGVVVDQSERITLEDLWIRGMLHTCVLFLTDRDSVLRNSLVERCGREGVVVAKALRRVEGVVTGVEPRGTRIEDNTIRRAGAVGIEVSTDGIAILRNLVSDLRITGILARKSRIVDNTVKNTRAVGIQARNSLVKRNKIRNVPCGIRTNEQRGNRFVDNDVSTECVEFKPSF